MSKQELTYESAYAELQHILQALQRDDINLDQLARELKRAKELVAFCKHKLRSVEEQLEDIFDEEE